MNWKVPLTDTTLGEEEVAAAARVLRSGWITMGAEVSAFEEEFAAAIGVSHALAVANGTVALHLAYLAAGLKEGEEFCLPALTFVATLNAGLYLRARPVLIDCASENDLTLSPEDLERKITPRTRLIVTLPYGGFPPAMERILEIAGRRGIPVVEDACHAPLAETAAGSRIGACGLASTWSFFGNKNLTTGEGGMVLTRDAAAAERMRLLRSHGMTTLTYDRHRGHASSYDVVAPGFNYRMDEIRAAIGREQLRKLPAATERRRAAAARLRRALEPLRDMGLTVPFEGHPGLSAHHLFVILLPRGASRESFRQILFERGVQTSVHYPPLHRFSHTRSLFEGARLPTLDAIEQRLVTLPMGPGMSGEQIEWVAESVKLALES